VKTPGETRERADSIKKGIRNQNTSIKLLGTKACVILKPTGFEHLPGKDVVHINDLWIKMNKNSLSWENSFSRCVYM